MTHASSTGGSPMRAELLERYRALPLPTTRDEHWRFTDLAGFDPDSFVSNGHAPVPGTVTEGARTLLEVDADAIAHVSEAGIEIVRAPDGIRFEPLGEDAERLASHRARVERDAELDWVTGGFGTKKGKVRIENDLAGQGATSRVTGAYFADGAQHLDYDTLQEHLAPSTTSDFAFKGALRDKATAVWRGMIRVEKDAQKTNAYQENRNLLLSHDAHADSIPGLEIEANDVRCTHGATVSQVDRDELFYCMARGLSRGEAERLIVRGFYQEIFDRIELEPVRSALQAALEARIPE